MSIEGTRGAQGRIDSNPMREFFPDLSFGWAPKAQFLSDTLWVGHQRIIVCSAFLFGGVRVGHGGWVATRPRELVLVGWCV